MRARLGRLKGCSCRLVTVELTAASRTGRLHTRPQARPGTCCPLALWKRCLCIGHSTADDKFCVSAEALAIIRTSNQGVDQTDGDDEIELDFQALDPSTLWSLDDYIRALPGVGGGGAGGGGGGGAGGSGNGQPVMANSDSDSESDSASE